MGEEPDRKQVFHTRMLNLTPEERNRIVVFADEGYVRVVLLEEDKDDGEVLLDLLVEEFCAFLFQTLYGIPTSPHQFR